MYKDKKMTRLLSLLFVGLLTAGCTSMQTLSSYARTGDTVMISLGGSMHNALVPVLKKENLQATITDSAGSTSTIKIRNLFKLHADPTSLYNYEDKSHLLSGQNNVDVDSYMDSYQGQWMAVVDLVDPATGLPVVVVPGGGYITISSAELDETFSYYNGEYYNGNLNHVDIEILAGEGTVNPLNYLTAISESPVNYLEPLPQVLITPQGAFDTQAITVAGLAYTISYNNADFASGGIVKKPNVTTQIVDSKSQLAVKYLPQDDGTTQIKILLMNPSGFIPHTSSLYSRQKYLPEASPFNALNVSLYWPVTPGTSDIDNTNWMNSIQLLSSNYIDINGNPMPELTANMQKVR